MQHIAKKSDFLPTFHRYRPESLGEIVYYDDKVNNFGVVGCAVRYTTSDVISFKSLHKCLEEINELNHRFAKNYFTCVAFQWVNEIAYDDFLINQKIITLLINTLRNVQVYVCKGWLNDDELPRI